MSEAKVEEFINLCQRGMSVLDYFLNFTNLSKYAPLVSNPRDEMSHFIMWVSNDLVEECCSTMLHYNMNISHIIVHAQQVEWIIIRKRIERTRGSSLLIVVLQKGVRKFKTTVESRKSSPIKFLKNIPMLMMIGCLALCLKRKNLLIHHATSNLWKVW